VQGDILQEAEGEAQTDDAIGLRDALQMVTAGAEIGEGGVGEGGELDAGGDEGAIELDDAAELNFEAELDGVGGEGFAFEDPASTVGEGGGERGKETLPVLIAIGLEIDCIHGVMGSFCPRSGFKGFIGSGVDGAMELRHVGHVTETRNH
jgi:hypothetical protein